MRNLEDPIYPKEKESGALLAAAVQLVVEDNRFGNIAHGPAPLLALPLQPSVSLFLSDF